MLTMSYRVVSETGKRQNNEDSYFVNDGASIFIVGDGVETVFLISQPQFSHISSTIVREIIRGGGDVSPFVPDILEMKELRN